MHKLLNVMQQASASTCSPTGYNDQLSMSPAKKASSSPLFVLPVEEEELLLAHGLLDREDKERHSAHRPGWDCTNCSGPTGIQDWLYSEESYHSTATNPAATNPALLPSKTLSDVESTQQPEARLSDAGMRKGVEQPGHS